MSNDVESPLSELKLTSDELGRLKKAFTDPEFRRLFKEYADELSDPQNRKRYEDDIRQLERERGMDVEFVNATPGHCLKTRHWPDISVSPVLQEVINAEDDQQDHDEEGSVDPLTQSNLTETKNMRNNRKVFINVCKSDKVACPEMKPARNSAGRQVPNGCYWTLPHCFSPPREEFDKKKKLATVYDVAFHPKAFELASTSPAMHRLLNVTAIDSVRKQYNLYLGKTFAQAMRIAKWTKLNPSRTVTEGSSPNRCESVGPTTVMREDALLRAVHTLKGTLYKGAPRPTVIRRRREDYTQRQAEWSKRAADDLAACADDSQQSEAVRRLHSYTPFSESDTSSLTGKDTTASTTTTTKTSSIKTIEAGPIEPIYTVTHSSDFELSDCRDAADVDPIRPPDRLCIRVQLPGLSSASCLDLDVSSSRLALKSEKPVSYRLDLKLPYEVDDSEGVAQFDKTTGLLIVTVPVVNTNVASNATLTRSKTFPSTTDSTVSTLNETIGAVTSPTSSESSADTFTLNEGHISTEASSQPNRRRRRKRNRRNGSCGAADNGNLAHDAMVVGHTPASSQNHESEKQLQEPPNDLGGLASQFVSAVFLSSSSATADICKSTKPDAPFDQPLTKVPIRRVLMTQLVVTKDRKLAPVHFRQDALSFSVLLGVRNILPDSFVISWSDRTAYLGNAADSDYDIPAAALQNSLLLLLTFASRGAGGCTMDWGVVLCCPSVEQPNSFIDQDKDASVGSDETAKEQSETNSCASQITLDKSTPPTPPKLITCSFSAANAVLMITKPTDPSWPISPNPGKTNWWSSVASGRTLTAGMQHCPFVGIEHCLGGAALPTGVASKSSSLPEHDNDLLHVLTLSTEVCEIRWQTHCLNDRQPQSLVSTSLLSPHSMESDLGVSTMLCSSDGLGQSSNPDQRQRQRRYTDQPNSIHSALPALKGILKQRSYSESSGDELTAVADIGLVLRGAGLANTQNDPFSSDDFPLVSSEGEQDSIDIDTNKDDRRRAVSLYTTLLKPNRDPWFHSRNDRFLSARGHMSGRVGQSCFRRSSSYDKFTTSGKDESRLKGNANIQTVKFAPDLPIRHRQRSVNFSDHDQQLAYSPRDTVHTLHHTLVGRRKKARRYATRRRGGPASRGQTTTSATKINMIDPSARSGIKRPTEAIGSGAALFQSANNSEFLTAPQHISNSCGDHFRVSSEFVHDSSVSSISTVGNLTHVRNNDVAADTTPPTQALDIPADRCIVETDPPTRVSHVSYHESPSSISTVTEPAVIASATQLPCCSGVNLCARTILELDDD